MDLLKIEIPYIIYMILIFFSTGRAVLAIINTFTKKYTNQYFPSISAIVFIGVLSLILVSGTFFKYGINNFYIIPLIGLGTAYTLKDIRHWRKFFSWDLFLLLFIYIVYFVYPNNYSGISYRQHVNPDIYGVISSIGYLNKNFSYERMLQEFYFFTGLDQPVWRKPPLLNDVWGIPDAQLRFAADQIIGSGRHGVPALISSITHGLIKPSILSFYSCFGLIILWAFSALSSQLVSLIIAVRNDNKEALNVSEFLPIKIIIGMIISISFFSQINFMGGHYVQLLQQSSILFIYICFIQLIATKEKNSTLLFIIINIATVSLYFVYPETIVSLAGIYLVQLVVILFINYKFHPIFKTARELVVLILSSTIPVIIIATDSRLMSQILERIKGLSQGGNVGGAIHLGFFPLELLTGFPIKHHSMFTSNGFYQQAFEINKTQNSYYISVFIIICLAAHPFIRKNKKIINILPIPFCLFSLLFISIFQSLRGLNISDYIFYRLAGSYFSIAYPLLLAAIIATISGIVNFLYKRKFFIKENRFFNDNTIITVLLLLTFGFALKGYRASTENYFIGSEFTYPATKCPNINYKESVFVSAKPDQKFFVLTYCGVLNYLTDNWAPQLKVSDTNYQVYFLQSSDQKIDITPIGRLKVNKEIIGPCDKNCIEKLIL